MAVSRGPDVSAERLPKHAVDRLLAVAAEQGDGDSPTLGLDLGKYRLVRELGRGGMGIVYEAEDTQLGRRVALKVMPETAGLSEVLRKRFAREAQSAAKLNHPNIAGVYEATPDYIAMQYIRGTPLLDVVRGNVRLAATLLRDAARAIGYAHEMGVIHRDLKPSNMLVELTAGQDVEARDAAAARIYIMDFGLAKESAVDSSLSGSGNILGTPAYMSPEQAEGRTHDIDRRSDVYGLGATLFACLTGAPPFAGKDVLQVLRRVAHDDAKAPRANPDLDAIVLKCLEKEQVRRYVTADALADDLDRWLAGVPVLAQPPSAAYKLRKFVSRHRGLVAASAVAVFVAGVLGTIAWTERKRAAEVHAAASDAARFADQVRVVLADVATHRRRGAVEDVRAALAGGLALVERFRERHADVGIAHYYRGLLLRGLGKNQAALQALDRALELEPGLAGARVQRGFVRLAHYERLQRDYEQQKGAGALVPGAAAANAATEARLTMLRRLAMADLESSGAATGGEAGQLTLVDTNLRSAELSRLRGSLDVAKGILDLVIELDPTSVDAHRALAQIAAVNRNTSSEALHLARANTLASQLGYGYGFANAFAEVRATGAGGGEQAWTGSDYSGWKRWNPAVPAVDATTTIVGIDAVVSDFTEVVARIEDSAAALADEAVARMRVAAAKSPSARLEAWRQAVQLGSDAIGKRAGVAPALNNRGICWSRIANALFAGGRQFEAFGAENKALADFDAALALDAEFGAARHNRALVWIDKATRLADYGRFRQAEVELTRAIGELVRAQVQDTEQTRIVVTLARVRAQRARLRVPLGDAKGAAADRLAAKQQLDAVLQQDPRRALALLERGLLLRDLGDVAAAARDLKAAKQASASKDLQARCDGVLDALHH